MKVNDPHNLPWEKMKFAEEEKILRQMAKNDAHWDYGYLFALERQKLICMRMQFSEKYSPLDKEQNAKLHRWIDLCIYLLQYLIRDGIHTISEEQVKKMNCRNLKGLLHPSTIEKFLNEKDEDCKYIDGERIYLRKMERLYYQIRLNHLNEWWY